MKTPNQIRELSPKLSGSEILDKEFRIKFRGYDPEEVNAYLDTVIQDYYLFEKYFTSVQDYIADLERGTQTSGKSSKIKMEDLSDDVQETLVLMKRILDKKRHNNTNN